MKTINHQGETLIAAGKGNCAGALTYINARTSEIVTVYQAICFSTGPAFSLACVPGNPTLQSVFIRSTVLGGLRLEEKVLILPETKSDPTRPRAVAAWLAVPPHLRKPEPVFKPRPAPIPRQPRLKGVICYVSPSGTYGRILTDDHRESIFVAGRDLAPGLSLRLGTCVSFVRVLNPKGPAASQVLLAA